MSTKILIEKSHDFNAEEGKVYLLVGFIETKTIYAVEKFEFPSFYQEDMVF